MFDLDSFLCNECGYSKYGRFEFTFMAKPSFTFDNMENDEDMNEFSEGTWRNISASILLQ